VGNPPRSEYAAALRWARLPRYVKPYTSELNGRMVDEGVQLHGGAGYMEEYPIGELYLDERVHRILAGTSEIMKEVIARSLLDR
jgi:alkylation response protein AidB-like acyl-CoA dehydrogenase